MSYILDALRKADAQRERDPARGIHAQSMRPASAQQAAAQGARAWPWIVGAVGLASVAVAAWQLMAPAPAPVAAPVAQLPPPPAVAAPPRAPVPASQVLPPAPPAPPAPPPVAAPAQVQPAPAVRETPKASPRPPAPAASQPSAAERLLPARDLPADLPKLAITGGVYSDNPEQRMLIVNGNVVNEGARLAPDVVLEEIRAKTAVLRVRGYRYSVPY
jgi:general secretion pathway protein B